MSGYSEDLNHEEGKKKGACGQLRSDFKQCLMDTDCVRLQKRSARECFEADEVPLECRQLRTLLFECKRSLLDNRLRFRGRKDY